MDDRQTRIHEQSKPLWNRIVKMTREYQARWFFWPDYIILDSKDTEECMKIWGYVPAKIAGVAVVSRDFTHMGSADKMLPTFQFTRERDIQWI